MIAVLPSVFIVYMPFVPAIISLVQGGSSRNIEPYMDYPILIIVGYFVLLFILIIIMQGVSIAIKVHFFQVCKNEDMRTPKGTGGYFTF